MNRKEMVKALGEHVGVKPRYLGAPSFAYEIETATETYIIDRAGIIKDVKGYEIEIEALVNDKVEEQTNIFEVENVLAIAVTMDGHTGNSLTNLVNMIFSKQKLIMKSLEIKEAIVSEGLVKILNEKKPGTIEEFEVAIRDKKCRCIDFNFDFNEITFNFFRERDTPEKITAYSQLIELLSQQAKNIKYASAKAKETDNEKFTFRVWLIRLGMIGGDYKETRRILLKNLTGNSAFRYGKPEKETTAGE